MKNFEGVFPIVNTPFSDNGSIDFESQRRLVRFLIDCGAHGLALFGNASEGYTLSNQERVELMNLIIREAKPESDWPSGIWPIFHEVVRKKPGGRRD